MPLHIVIYSQLRECFITAQYIRVFISVNAVKCAFVRTHLRGCKHISGRSSLSVGLLTRPLDAHCFKYKSKRAVRGHSVLN